jgi:acyl carrier protein
MNISKFTELFAEQLNEANPKDTPSDMCFQAHPEWGSLSIMLVIAMIRTECGKTVTLQELESCNTIQDVYGLVTGKQ